MTPSPPICRRLPVPLTARRAADRAPVRARQHAAPVRALPVAAALALSLLLSAGVTRAAVAQGADRRDMLLLLSASDTISVERFSRTPTRFESEMLIRAANARFTLGVDLAPDGAALALQNAYRQGAADPASAPLQSAVARFTGDSVIIDVSGGGRTSTQRFGTRAGAVPFLNPSFALVELMIARARAIGGDSVGVPVWNLQGGTTASATVIRRGGDSVVVLIGAVPAHLAVNAAGDITGGSVPAQGLRIVRVRGGDARAMSVEKPDYSAPAGAPYTAEDVTIPTPGGHTLAGTLTLPRDRARPVPAVVTISGSGPQDRDEAIPIVKGYRPFRQIADTLGRNGIAVLRYDDRGTGASTGNHATATSADFADDVRAVLAYLRTRPEIDASRLALVGHSEGGLIAPMVAASDPSLRGIVLMAGPAQTGREILRYQIGAGITRSAALSPAQRDSARRTVEGTIDSLGRAQPWVKYFLDHDPLVTARRVKVPTLILQGETDRQVTAEQAESLERALRAGGNRRVARRVFSQANHLFAQDADGSPEGYPRLPDRRVRSDVLAALTEWLRTTLR
ncbi:MAG: hypothetical protein AMXMBFR55_23490 [Gemmatimonadota bacterium]